MGSERVRGAGRRLVEQLRLGVEKLLQEEGRGRKKATVVVLKGMICFVCNM